MTPSKIGLVLGRRMSMKMFSKLFGKSILTSKARDLCIKQTTPPPFLLLSFLMTAEFSKLISISKIDLSSLVSEKQRT